MVSRKDVAKLAGVSPSSVSFYVNNSGYVGEATRVKIEKAIEELGYIPNQIARSLRMNDRKQFLFFCNEIRNPFYAELVHTATKEAEKQGYMIMFASATDSDERIKKMCGYQVAGVFASNSKMSMEVINSIAERNLQVVLLRDIEWDDLSNKITQIQINYDKIMNQIYIHLKEQGYKDIKLFTSSSVIEKGKMDEKTRHFLEVDGTKQEDVVLGIFSGNEAYEYIVDNYVDYCPDAIICTNDALAAGVMRGLREIGKKIPEVGVVGFDNSLNSEYAVPMLTSVDIGMHQIGTMIIELLIQRLNKETVENRMIEPKLIIRNSSVRK